VFFHKALGGFQIRGVRNFLTLIQNGLSSTEMNTGGSQRTDGAAVMFVVLQTVEFSCPSKGISLTAETFTIIGTIFQGFPGTARAGVNCASENGLLLETCG
jgi:hypothetical protein